ncbi:MAG: FkbM family methyltransferase [Roseimicrobium sp.]
MLGTFFQRLVGLGGFALVDKKQYQRLRRLENYKPSDSTFNEHLKQLFKRLEVTCVLDVGANDGAYAESLRHEVGYQGWIHSFEPLPKQLEVLRSKAAKDPRWVIHPYALGAESGAADFHVMSSDVFSSFLTPDPNQPVKYADSNRVSQTLSVTIRTIAEVLPDILAQHGAGPVYLKMDTQGYDLQVFAGAQFALPHIVALQSELAFNNIYAQAPGWQEMVRAFGEGGFRPSFLLPISFDSGLGILEADGIFVRAATLQ